jgi:hypothetical protein
MEVGLRNYSKDGVKKHIEQATMRNDQVASMRTVNQALHSFTCP